MNSLNLLSARVSSQSTPNKGQSERRRSYSEGTLKRKDTDTKVKRTSSHRVKHGGATEEKVAREKDHASDEPIEIAHLDQEKNPLLRDGNAPSSKAQSAKQKLFCALSSSIRWLIHTLGVPIILIVRGFYDERGRLSLLAPIRRIRGVWSSKGVDDSGAKSAAFSPSSSTSGAAVGGDSEPAQDKKNNAQRGNGSGLMSGSQGGSESWLPQVRNSKSNKSSITTSSSSDESTQIRRSVRLKVSHGDTARKRKQKRVKGDADGTNNDLPPLTVDNIKSPIAPTSNLRSTETLLPLDPPRPLIPRRQPSYTSSDSRFSKAAQKTLVIDLDETLIHSLAKGGRMSSGHMVEVKLNTTVGFSGSTIGPQHPILYYVHKRPHCDEFLRKVCKWYNLVLFTASVQEYADPVIDWLEQERKYFSGRLYRQHCTFRNGAYIKDLSSVEPDLSKIMILDNSPLSYIFHEGWLYLALGG